MQEGVFALIDCLGFKGIWEKHDPSLLLTKFSNIAKTVNESIINAGSLFTSSSYAPIRVYVQLLSDTVALSLQHELNGHTRPDELQENKLCNAMGFAVLKVLDLFLKDEPALVLRGCITYGKHITDGNFIAGPAVDLAAEHMNLPEGAFIWLHPTAAERYQNFCSEVDLTLQNPPPGFIAYIKARKFEPDVLKIIQKVVGSDAQVSGETLVDALKQLNPPNIAMSYTMPIKGGRTVDCLVINPLSSYRSIKERISATDTYSKITMSHKLDILIKHQNTMKFLVTANQLVAEYHQRLNDSFGIDILE